MANTNTGALKSREPIASSRRARRDHRQQWRNALEQGQGTGVLGNMLAPRVGLLTDGRAERGANSSASSSA